MVNQEYCEQLLQQHGIKPTANRIVVVRTLATAGRPMSLTELEYKILSIDKETGACRVETVFFGRATPVDVDFSDIEKI